LTPERGRQHSNREREKERKRARKMERAGKENLSNSF